jgi:(S)-2-hydroxy-acid oxidase
MHQLAHPDGEVATSRAAAKHDVAMGVSAYATYSMEDVIAQSSGNPYAFQVTILKDRSLTLKMIQRAESKCSFLP